MLSESEVLNLIEQSLLDEIVAHPNWPDKQNRLGEVYAFRARHEKAVPYFEKAITINPNYKKPYINKALALINLGQPVQAVTTFLTTAPRSFENDFLWMGPLGAVHLKLHLFESAHEKLSLAIQSDPLNALWPLYRALACWYLGEIDPARQDLAMAIEICPTLPNYLREYGLTPEQMNKYTVEPYLNHLELNRSLAGICQDIGQFYFMREMFDQARRYFERALWIDLNLSAYHTWLGQMHEFKGEYAQAVAAFWQATQFNPRNVLANTLLATEEAMQGNLEAAQRIYQNLVDSFPRFPDLRYKLGLLCSDAADHAAAIAQFEAAITLNTDYMSPQLGLAFSLLQIGQLERSLQIYKQIIAAGVVSADIYLQMNHIYRQLGQFADAADVCRQAYQLDTSYPSVLYEWGLTLYHHKDFKAAKEKWQLYLATDALGAYQDQAQQYLLEMEA